MKFFCKDIIMSSNARFEQKQLKINLSGCDFRCGYCNTPQLIEFKEEHKISTREIKKEIENHLAYIDSIVFSGGEPALQRQALLNIARDAKQKNLKIGIETNGSRPDTIKSMIRENLIDFIALDIKCPLEPEFFEKVTNSKTFFKDTPEIIENLKKTIRILNSEKNKIDITIRTTIIPDIVSEPECLEKIADIVQDINCVWEFQAFIPGNNISQKYSKIESPSQTFLKNLKKIMLEKYPRLKIEINNNEMPEEF